MGGLGRREVCPGLCTVRDAERARVLQAGAAAGSSPVLRASSQGQKSQKTATPVTLSGFKIQEIQNIFPFVGIGEVNVGGRH